jgi:hypothetical protein
MASTADAGCILASLTYMINTFQQFREIATKDEKLAEYGYCIENAVDELDGECIAFDNILCHIFSGKKPVQRAQWEKKETTYMVKKTLGPRYGRFRVIIARMTSHVYKLASLGHLDHAEVPPLEFLRLLL